MSERRSGAGHKPQNQTQLIRVCGVCIKPTTMTWYVFSHILILLRFCFCYTTAHMYLGRMLCVLCCRSRNHTNHLNICIGMLLLCYDSDFVDCSAKWGGVTAVNGPQTIITSLEWRRHISFP